MQENDKAIQEKSSINEALRRANDVSTVTSYLQQSLISKAHCKQHKHG